MFPALLFFLTHSCPIGAFEKKLGMAALFSLLTLLESVSVRKDNFCAILGSGANGTTLWERPAGGYVCPSLGSTPREPVTEQHLSNIPLCSFYW